MTEHEKMRSGALYNAGDEALQRARMQARKLTRLFNHSAMEAGEYRGELLEELFAACGKNLYIEPSFRCDYGKNISIGDDFYANYDCIILDVCPVTIGDRVLFGPRVCLCTAAHPIDARLRASGLEYGAPITIGDDVWLGCGAIVNPGITIGARTSVGAGSVVTKDLPADVVAVGNPCRVLRPVAAEDRPRENAPQNPVYAAPEARA